MTKETMYDKNTIELMEKQAVKGKIVKGKTVKAILEDLILPDLSVPVPSRKQIGRWMEGVKISTILEYVQHHKNIYTTLQEEASMGYERFAN